MRDFLYSGIIFLLQFKARMLHEHIVYYLNIFSKSKVRPAIEGYKNATQSLSKL